MSDQSQMTTNTQSDPVLCKLGCGFFVSTDQDNSQKRRKRPWFIVYSFAAWLHFGCMGWDFWSLPIRLSFTLLLVCIHIYRILLLSTSEYHGCSHSGPTAWIDWRSLFVWPVRASRATWHPTQSNNAWWCLRCLSAKPSKLPSTKWYCLFWNLNNFNSLIYLFPT